MKTLYTLKFNKIVVNVRFGIEIPSFNTSSARTEREYVARIDALFKYTYLSMNR